MLLEEMKLRTQVSCTKHNRAISNSFTVIKIV